MFSAVLLLRYATVLGARTLNVRPPEQVFEVLRPEVMKRRRGEGEASGAGP
jgi:hypothetical protein